MCRRCPLPTVWWRVRASICPLANRWYEMIRRENRYCVAPPSTLTKSMQKKGIWGRSISTSHLFGCHISHARNHGVEKKTPWKSPQNDDISLVIFHWIRGKCVVHKQRYSSGFISSFPCSKFAIIWGTAMYTSFLGTIWHHISNFPNHHIFSQAYGW